MNSDGRTTTINNCFGNNISELETDGIIQARTKVFGLECKLYIKPSYHIYHVTSNEMQKSGGKTLRANLYISDEEFTEETVSAGCQGNCKCRPIQINYTINLR